MTVLLLICMRSMDIRFHLQNIFLHKSRDKAYAGFSGRFCFGHFEIIVFALLLL